MADLGARQNQKISKDKLVTIDVDTGNINVDTNLIVVDTTKISTNGEHTQEPLQNPMIESVIDNAVHVDVIALRKLNVFCVAGGIIEIILVGTANFMVQKTLVPGDNLAKHLGKEFFPDLSSDDGNILRIQVPGADPGVFNIHHTCHRGAIMI